MKEPGFAKISAELMTKLDKRKELKQQAVLLQDQFEKARAVHEGDRPSVE